MSRLGTFLFCSAFAVGAALVACGGGGGGEGGASGGGSPGTGGSGGGGSTGAATAVDAIPKAAAITGWSVDPSNSKTASVVAATGTTETQVVDLIDGAAAEFFAAPFTPVQFAWQNYVNPSLPAPMGSSAATLKLYVLQMPDGTQAANLYTSLLSASLYKGNTWTDPTTPAIGSKSRITDSGADWWINFVKGKFYVEVRMSPSYGAAPDYNPGDATTKKAALDFAAAVAAGM